MNWDVHRWDRINAIKKSISVANHRAFAFQFRGIVTAQMTAMTIQMKKNAEQFHVQRTFTSATIPTVYSKLTYATTKTIVVIFLNFIIFIIVFYRQYRCLVKCINFLIFFCTLLFWQIAYLYDNSQFSRIPC